MQRQRRSEAGAAHRKPYSAGLTSGLVRRLPLCFSCVRAGFPFEIKDQFLIEMCRCKRALGTFIRVGTLYTLHTHVDIAIGLEKLCPSISGLKNDFINFSNVCLDL